MFLRFLGRFLDFLPTLFHSNKDVVRLIFEYIKMLQRLEPNKRYWKERIHIIVISGHRILLSVIHRPYCKFILMI